MGQIVLMPSSFSQQRHIFLMGKTLNCGGESVGQIAASPRLYQTRSNFCRPAVVAHLSEKETGRG